MFKENYVEPIRLFTHLLYRSPELSIPTFIVYAQFIHSRTQCVGMET